MATVETEVISKEQYDRDIASAERRQQCSAAFVRRAVEAQDELEKLKQVQLIAVADESLAVVVIMVNGRPLPRALNPYTERSDASELQLVLDGFAQRFVLDEVLQDGVEALHYALLAYESQRLWVCGECGQNFDHVEADGVVCRQCQ